MSDLLAVLILAAAVLLFSGAAPLEAIAQSSQPAASRNPYVVVLGIAQDAGYPQAGCNNPCCQAAWSGRVPPENVACLALVNPRTADRWLFDATPSFGSQLHRLDQIAPPDGTPGLSGIFLTHAHIGHYTGLMQLGREVIGAKDVPVYAMPRMQSFLTNNGPWDQLVELGNIRIKPLTADEPVSLPNGIRVTPIVVPHRDEYSETVGYRIAGSGRFALYIPDIDKWTRWDRSIERLITEVDVAFLDGTFYADGEIPNRNMADIPHPFIDESMKRFETLPPEERDKIHFIHLNHTNPALQPDSDARKAIEQAGFHVATTGERFEL